MDFYTGILAKALSRHGMKVTFENLEIKDPDDIVENTCRAALEQIREILDNDEFDDFECVERIVCLLQDIGSDGGFRHDF